MELEKLFVLRDNQFEETSDKIRELFFDRLNVAVISYYAEQLTDELRLLLNEDLSATQWETFFRVPETKFVIVNGSAKLLFNKKVITDGEISNVEEAYTTAVALMIPIKVLESGTSADIISAMKAFFKISQTLSIDEVLKKVVGEQIESFDLLLNPVTMVEEAKVEQPKIEESDFALSELNADQQLQLKMFSTLTTTRN